MKTLIRTGVLSILVSLTTQAADYPQHDMQQIVLPSTEGGRYTLNFRDIDHIIDDLHDFAGSYPPVLSPKPTPIKREKKSLCWHVFSTKACNRTRTDSSFQEPPCCIEWVTT